MWKRIQRQRETDEEEAESAIEVLIKVGLTLGLLIFAGRNPDEDWEIGFLLVSGFIALVGYAFSRQSYLEVAVWVVFAGLAQPIFVPDLPVWAWKALSYVGAFLLLLSWLLPVYLNFQRTKRRDRLAPKSARPQPMPKRHNTTQARTTYPKDDPRAKGKD